MGWSSGSKGGRCAEVLRKPTIGYNCYNSALESPRSLSLWVKQGYTVIGIDGRHITPLPPHLRERRLPDYSTDNTEEVLREVCGDNLVYERLCATQKEKRQRYMDIAGELNSDLLVVFDSDDYLHPEYQDWDRFNFYINKMMESPNETEIGYMWCWIPSDDIWSKQYNAVASNSWVKYSRVHKNPGQQHYVVNHWSFTDKKTLETVTEEEIGIWSYTHYDENPYLLKTRWILDGVRFTTDRIYRSPSQLEHGHGWAYQETNEDDFRLYCWWLKTQKVIPKIDITKPHYFNEKGKLVWY